MTRFLEDKGCEILQTRPGEGVELIISPREKDLGGFTMRRVLPVAGRRMVGPRFIDWNFVSSRKARIEQAKADWRAGWFPPVPGEEGEYIPLPE